ncbi:MAG TPA: hypothetical protein PKB07_17860, partial [Flavilitoribacter sp.]|nr:hypothetical protein [Flavilitoribacter sp.]
MKFGLNIYTNILIFSCLLATMCHLSGQKNEIIFNHLTHDDGIEDDNYNMYVKRDSRGFAWISSMNGIYRFDGLNIVPFNSKNSNILGDIVTSTFFEDNIGNIWFTTYTALHCYNRVMNKITPIQLANITGDTIIENYQLFHFQSKDNSLFLKAGSEIYHFYISDKKNYFSLGVETNCANFSVDTTQNGEIKCIIGCPWINRSGFDIIKPDYKSGKWEKGAVAICPHQSGGFPNVFY